MSGGPDNQKTQRFTRAAFLCAALVLLALFLRLLIHGIVPPASSAASTPAPSPSAEVENHTVVFFGTASDPFCAPLFTAVNDFTAANGWRLIRYDCRGNATNQKGQIEDFLRSEAADIAVLYSVLEQAELDTQVKAISKTCPVVTVGNSVSARSKRYVTAHVGVDETERVRILAEYFRENLRKDSGILLICEVPDETAEALYSRVLSEENVTLLGKNYSWGGAAYVQRYLNTLVEDFSPVGGVLCVSRHGTVGTAVTLEEKGLRSGIKIASLTYEPAMADDMALGDLDAAVAASPREAAEMLEDILPKGIKGETIEGKNLPLVLLTPENVDTVDLGY